MLNIKMTPTVKTLNSGKSTDAESLLGILADELRYSIVFILANHHSKVLSLTLR